MAVTVDIDTLTPRPMDERSILLTLAQVETLGVLVIDNTQPVIDPPVVASVSPAPGTKLSPATPLSFTFSHAGDARVGVALAIQFAGSLTTELVYDGTAFTPQYAGGSTFVKAGSTASVMLVRSGGWPAAPTLSTFTLYNG